MALVHYPVLNRRGEVIASAVTNLDLHDLGRTCRTYGVPACYIVTPLEDQRTLVMELIAHWCEGVGKRIHPDRAEALGLLRVVDSVEEAQKEITAQCGRPPVVWATSARKNGAALGIAEARRKLAADPVPRLLLFGTGWGLTPELTDSADAVLEPVRGRGDYNHLSVRCAAAILLDRLTGCGDGRTD